MNDVSLQTILTLAARHLLTVAGGWLIHQGYLDASGQEAFIGAGMTVAGVLWSWWQKRGQAMALADAARAYDSVTAQLRSFRKLPAASVGAKQ